MLEQEASRSDVQWTRLHMLLQPDSGTARADASLESWKKTYDVLVDSIGRDLQTAIVQVMIGLHGRQCCGSVPSSDRVEGAVDDATS